MRTKSQLIDVILPLVINPPINDILGEHIAFEKKIVVFFQSLESFIQGTRQGRDIRQFFRPQSIDILIERLTRIEFIHIYVFNSKIITE